MSWLREHRDQIRKGLIGAAVFGAAVVLASGVYLYRQRVATEAEIAMRQYESELAAGNTIASSEQTGVLKEFCFNTEDGLVEWNGKTYKRNSYTKAILVAGIDRSNEMTEEKGLGEAGQADGIFLIAQDTARNELKILNIPRDTITEITIADQNGNVKGTAPDHLSLAFAYGDGRHRSGEYLTKAVSEFLQGFEIQKYFAVDMAMISDLNDAVGGVTVTIPEFGMEHADSAFVPGEQITLHGKQAESFVRYRDTNQDHSAIARMNQHKEYITQYFRALKQKSRENSQIVTELFDMIENYMVTNMVKDEYMKIALDAINSDGIGTDDFKLVPGKGITTEEYDEFHANIEETIPVILELFYREVS